MKGQCRYKYLVIRRDRSYFAKKTLRFYEKVLRNLYHQNARDFFIDNMFVMLGGRVFSTDSWHAYGYKLCSTYLRLVPLFV